MDLHVFIRRTGNFNIPDHRVQFDTIIKQHDNQNFINDKTTQGNTCLGSYLCCQYRLQSIISSGENHISKSKIAQILRSRTEYCKGRSGDDTAKRQLQWQSFIVDASTLILTEQRELTSFCMKILKIHYFAICLFKEMFY